jgi:DNA-binding CsgD family transcriptional regulator
MSGDGATAALVNPMVTRTMAGTLSNATTLLLAQTRVECAGIARQLGFSYFYFMLSAMAPPGVPLRLRVDHTPPGFRTMLDEHLDGGRSPLLDQVMASLLPFLLNDVSFDRTIESFTLLERSRSFGIADALVLPLHGPRCAHGMLLLLDEALITADAFRKATLHGSAQWASMTLLHRLTTEIAGLGQKNKRRQLTPRQSEALLLASQGLTLAEIATALLVHTSTARYLIARAIEKLGVDTRAEAILRIAAITDFRQTRSDTVVYRRQTA